MVQCLSNAMMRHLQVFSACCLTCFGISRHGKGWSGDEYGILAERLFTTSASPSVRLSSGYPPPLTTRRDKLGGYDAYYESSWSYSPGKLSVRAL